MELNVTDLPAGARITSPGGLHVTVSSVTEELAPGYNEGDPPVPVATVHGVDGDGLPVAVTYHTDAEIDVEVDLRK